jgi:hypothetical protein
MPETTPQPNPPRSSSFVPFLLLAVSLIAVLSWQLWVGNQGRLNGRRLQAQQTRTVEESKQIQRKLEELARDLINVAQSDNDARALVTKYHITFRSPSPTASRAAK